MYAHIDTHITFNKNIHHKYFKHSFFFLKRELKKRKHLRLIKIEMELIISNSLLYKPNL